MKLFVYFLVGMSFLSSTNSLRAELPPVLELYRQNTLQVVKKGLGQHFTAQDYSLQLKVTEKKSSNYAGEGLEMKDANGEIPKTGLYLPKVKDVLGETRYLLGKVSLKLEINKELDEEKATAIKEQVAKWAKINPARGDQFAFDYRLKPSIAVQLPVVPLTEEQVEQSFFASFPTKVVGLSVLGLLLLIWGFKRAKVTTPKTETRQEEEMDLASDLQNIEIDSDFEELEIDREISSSIDEDIDFAAEVEMSANFDIEIDLELDLDHVIADAEEAITAAELEIHEQESFSEILEAASKVAPEVDFSFLNSADETKLLALIHKETPIVKALILNKLALAKGEEVYQKLDDDEQFAAVCEISNLGILTQEDLEDLASELKVKLSKLGRAKLKLAATQAKPVAKVSEFTFEKISTLPFKFITDLVNRIVLVDLGIALVYAPKEVREKMLLCLDAQRRKEFIRSAGQIRANEFESFAKQELILKLAGDLASSHSSNLAKIANG
ncbi:MAG: hypothetical protein QNL04_03745 [SAR324 cluster bacterium]|nr:hypothetical protein [SAR324 cluster bacterium]